MKKLFLASVVGIAIDKMIEILPKPPNETKVAFVPTAASPYGFKWFLSDDLNALKNKGFDFKQVDIENKTEQELLKEFENIDVLLVGGGNTFYLLQEAKKSGFEKIVHKLLQKGVIYAGSSAGAILACPTIEPAKEFDDPAEAPDLKSFAGLNLVDFIILAHFDEKKNKGEYENVVKRYGNLRYKFILLTDKQAIIVDGDKYKIV